MKKNIFTIPLFVNVYPDDLEVIENNIRLYVQSVRSVKRSNVHGYQSLPDLHHREFMQPFMRWLCDSAGEAFEELGHTRQHVDVEGCWFNINDTLNSHNQIHNHSGIVSGVFYIKAPEGSGNLQIMNMGMNQMWPGHNQADRPSSSTAAHYTIKPRAGDLYIWPSYLYHSVDSNTKDVERISISFNLT